MFTLSDDKSAYGTLKGLVEHLESDAREANHAMTKYSERSRDYARAEGARGAYNLTISLIMGTDIWRVGKHAEKEAAVRPPHWHMLQDGKIRHTAVNEPTMRAMLAHDGHTTEDAFRLAASGYSLKQCQGIDCA